MTVDRTRQILLSDLDPDFVRSVSIALAWEYSDLFAKLASAASIDNEYNEQEFNRRRGDCAVRALAGAATRHGVPYNFRRLEVNGQRKLLVKAGRVILIQEPIVSVTDHPSTADYKRQLADVHAFVRQLELELGDQPLRIRDWSGCVLAVLLHGPAGTAFHEEQKALGNVMLGVPDSAYRQWIMRLDLHSIAMHGRMVQSQEAIIDEGSLVQEDKVFVTPKRRNSEKNTA